jgi:hypothetical protein
MEEPAMATRVVAVRREAGIHNRVEARLDTGLVLFVTEDEVHDHHRRLPPGTFAANPCRFIGAILGFR